MSEKTAFPEQIPQAIGRYQIQASIGYGAMGAVYKAFDPLIKRTLAIKTIRLDIPRQSPQYKSFIERFYHEARISGTLSHPNIVTLFDIGEENGIPYLAMEYVEGETIASLIEKGVRFPPEKVIGLVSQVASAVDYAHSKGVIHRDIKPSNLILYEAERVKVTDFGIAKLVDAEMTASGTLLGTPSYMSPEQAMGDKLDGRSDIFSLGVCTFEMLSGEQPFPGNNVTSILYKLVHVDPIEPANLEMNGLVPQRWHEVFGRVLAKKPDDRYQTATEFVQDLEYCLGSWFGAAMGDEAAEAPGGAPPASRPGAPADSPDATSPLARPDVDGPRPAARAERPAAAPPPLPAPREAGPADVTGSLPAMTPALAGAPPPAPTPPPAAPKAAAPPPAPTAGASSKPPAKAPGTVAPAKSDESSPTVVMTSPPVMPTKKPAPASPAPPAVPAVGPTVVMKPSEVKADTAEATVMMTGPPQRPEKGKGKGAPPPKPPAPSTAAEKTVLMMSGDGAPRGDDATSRAPILPQTVRQPIPEEPARPPAPPSPKATQSRAAPVAAAGAPAPVAGPRKGLPVPAMVLGGVALVAVIVTVVLLVGRTEPPDASPSPTASTTVAPRPTETPTPSSTATPLPFGEGVLLIESQPAGAAVTINGEPRGQTPLELTGLPAGMYQVKLERRGYEPRSETLLISAETPRAELKGALTRTAPVTGTADVFSTPLGVSVSIDGSPAGVTPLTGVKLKPGSHRFEFTKPGYEPRIEAVTVEAGKSARVDVTLKGVPRPIQTPTPDPNYVDPNKVYLDTEVDVRPKKLSGSASYPDNAPSLKSGQSVSVEVSFVVSENGEIGDVKLLASSGNKVVDDAVVNAVARWKYAPGVKKGVKVKVRVGVRQTFRAG